MIAPPKRKWSPSPDGCPELAEKLEGHFGRMARQIETWNQESEGNLEGLVLGGGYGRGEGGILRDSRGEIFPYNDLDYFLFIRRGLRPSEQERLRQLEIRESEALAVDVEIKALPLSALEQASESMMFYDLVAGHRVIWGEADLLSSYAGDLDPSRIGLREATHLLWNRGSGLYFARCRIAESRDPDFVARNHHKAALALGDALLAADGLYHVSVRERRRRLEPLGWYGRILNGLEPEYDGAIEAKFHPRPEPAEWESLSRRNEELTRQWSHLFLELESRRLGTRFSSLAEYANQSGRLMRKVPLWKAPLFAVRDRIRHGDFLRPRLDYPRGALYRTLACFNDLERSPMESAREAGRFLPEPKSMKPFVPSDWEPVYTRWWERYS